jgi:hypothetical protein
VRVASDGDNHAASAGSADGEQTVTDSNGSAQVAGAGVNAPVRVASDGDNGGSGGSGSSTGSGDQTVTGSTGTAQIASPSVSAPISVLSDGDEVPVSGDGDTATNAQGEPMAPLDGETGAQGGPVGVTGTLPGGGIGTPAGAGGTGGGLTLAADFTPDAAGTLPLTGLGAGLLLALGLLLLASGGALRRGSVATG